MKQTAINLNSNKVWPTLQSSAFAKARLGYFLGQCGIWRYPAIMVVCDR